MTNDKTTIKNNNKKPQKAKQTKNKHHFDSLARMGVVIHFLTVKSPLGWPLPLPKVLSHLVILRGWGRASQRLIRNEQEKEKANSPDGAKSSLFLHFHLHQGYLRQGFGCLPDEHPFPLSSLYSPTLGFLCSLKIGCFCSLNSSPVSPPIFNLSLILVLTLGLFKGLKDNWL